MLHSPPEYDDAIVAGISEEPARGGHDNDTPQETEKVIPDSTIESSTRSYDLRRVREWA